MSAPASRSWFDILKAYFRLGFFLLVIFMVPFALTGQYLAGVLTGIIVLYLAYRLFVVCGDLTFTPGISSPFMSVGIVFVFLVIISVFGLFIHWQPMAMPSDRDLLRHALTLGIPIAVGIAGYLLTRPRD